MTAGKFGFPKKGMKVGKVILGTDEHIRVLNVLEDALKENVSTPVDWQSAVELMTVSFVCKMPPDKWDFVADAIHKHVKQTLRNFLTGNLI